MSGIEETVAWTVADPRVQPEPNTGCWLWVRHISNGYGVTTFRGKRPFRAHRAFWLAAGHSIPDGMVLDHTCRVRSCVNPAHLRTVTPKVNTLENSAALTAINARKAACPRCGGEYVMAKRGFRECVPCRKKRIGAINARRSRCKTQSSRTV